jgi:hypothetical protein
LKNEPKTVPGATKKLNTALNKFSGVGSKTALSNISASRDSSLDHALDITSFHDEGDETGIFRALTITFVRKGSKSSKVGTESKDGMRSFSGVGVETKEATGSGHEVGVEVGVGRE